MRELHPPTSTQIAESLYKHLLRARHEFDPRLWPLGLLEWERLPSLSKLVLIQAIEDMQAELY